MLGLKWMGMKKKNKDQWLLIVENGGGEQHTGVEIRLDMLRSLRKQQRGK